MIVLTLRTDRPEAEIAIFENFKKISEIKWLAHKILADTIHFKINELLNISSLDMSAIQGLAVYKGPGSFTGLRIGLTVANTLAQSLSVPIVAAGGLDWQKQVIKKLENGLDDKIALPEYGAGAKTTRPKK